MCNPFLSHLHEDHEWDCFEPLMEDENDVKDVGILL